MKLSANSMWYLSVFGPKAHFFSFPVIKILFNKVHTKYWLEDLGEENDSIPLNSSHGHSWTSRETRPLHQFAIYGNIYTSKHSDWFSQVMGQISHCKMLKYIRPKFPSELSYFRWTWSCEIRKYNIQPFYYVVNRA